MATVTKSIAAEGALDALPTEPPARHAGAYTIVAPIAAGGGGTVWLARDERSGNPPRMVAVKFLHPDIASAPASRRRFLREAEFAASIHHPNVVEVVEVGEASGHPYLVMPFVAGTTVRQLLRRGQLPIDAVLAMVSDALRGLTAAHELRGADGAPLELVHRDISPHNLLVAIDGTTKLTDFGIARPALDAGVSTTRWAQGKVSYFSPEQGRGEPLDRRSDLFAMGIILWECLTGRSLFRADDPFVVAHRVQTMRVPAPSTVRKGLTAELDAVVAKALASDRDQRYASAALMLEALSDAAAQGGIEVSRAAVASLVAGEVERESMQARATETPRRLARSVAATSVAAIAIAAAVFGVAIVVGGVAMARHRSGADVAAPSVASPPAESQAVPATSTGGSASLAPPASVSPPAPSTAVSSPSKSTKVVAPGRRAGRPGLRPAPSVTVSATPQLPSPTNPF